DRDVPPDPDRLEADVRPEPDRPDRPGLDERQLRQLLPDQPGPQDQLTEWHDLAQPRATLAADVDRPEPYLREAHRRGDPLPNGQIDVRRSPPEGSPDPLLTPSGRARR